LTWLSPVVLFCTINLGLSRSFFSQKVPALDGAICPGPRYWRGPDSGSRRQFSPEEAKEPTVTYVIGIQMRSFVSLAPQCGVQAFAINKDLSEPSPKFLTLSCLKNLNLDPLPFFEF